MLESKAWCRTRPVRVAFLVEDSEHAQFMLDAIFADCYARWGGRYSLIVPCWGGRVPSGYWPWLECFDPDIVYSYVRLSEADVLELHERVYPSEYILHKRYESNRFDARAFKPQYDFELLSSASVLFNLSRYRRGSGQKTQILDAWFTERPSRFFTDNFGTYISSFSSGEIPADASAAASLLTIVSPAAFEDERPGIPRDLNRVDSEAAAMREFAEKRASSVALLSALAPKIEVPDDRFGASFSLVVGDSFSDRIVFWNARLLIPSWLDADTCGFRITPEQMESADFVETLRVLLNRRNHVNRGSGGGSHITVRSSSQTEDKLAKVVETLRKARV